MLKTWLTRMAVVGGVVAAAVVASTGPVMADSDKIIGDVHGTMQFIDDGDMFKVCDTRADGHGVVGKLWRKSQVTGRPETVVLTIDDGGDSGCDKDGYNVGNDGWIYQMRLYWNGSRVADSEWFNE